MDNGTTEDNLYNTADGLAAVTIKADRAAGQELADAYCCCEEADLSAGSLSKTFTLRRPFGKIRLVSTDAAVNTNLGGAYVPASTTVTYGADIKVPAQYNVLTGEASGETEAGSYTFTPYEEEVTVGDVNKGRLYILGVDYIFASSALTAVSFDVKVDDNGARNITSIPVEANKLTTVIGNFYTNNGDFEVFVDDELGNGGEYEVGTAVITSLDEVNQALAAGKTKIVFDGAITGSDNSISIPENAPAKFSIDLGSEISGYSPAITLEGNPDDNTQREITLQCQATRGILTVDINTPNTTYTIEGRYAKIINRQATSLVKTMGYINSLELGDGDAEIYANLGTVSTNPYNFIDITGSGVIKYVLIDTGAELSSYGRLANEGKCEKICLDKDVTYVNSLYLAGDINLNGHKVTLSSNSSGTIPYFYVESDLTMYDGEISCSCIDDSYSLFQIQNESSDADVDIRLTNVDIQSNINVFAAICPGSITLADCEISTDHISVISTNAAQAPQIDIDITGSVLTGKSTILKNVPGTMTISGSSITGSIQGVVVRGGEAVISNSTITLTYDNPDYQTDLDAYKNGFWGQGNQLPLAAMTIGNRSESAYRYSTKVTLQDTDLVLAGAYGSQFPALYAYANQEDGQGVTLNYDDACQFGGGLVYGSGNIVVNGTAATPDGE